MPAIRAARTRIERIGSRRSRDIRARLAEDVRRAREDAGLSQRSLARAAGIGYATLNDLERGTHDPSTEVLARVAAALGMDLAVRLYPGTGPLIRDHLQEAMIAALLGILHPRWRPTPEVWVTRPLKGVIDLVLEATDASDAPLIAVEAQSELRRIEQQVRWAHAKAEGLADARGRPVSSLLLLRSTRRTRAVVAEHEATVRAAFPGVAAHAHAALAGAAGWPGTAIIWCDVGRSEARLLSKPPRAISVGR